MPRKDNEITSNGIKVRSFDKIELDTFLKGKKGSKKIILHLAIEKRCLDFSEELENLYFKPGTAANEDFILIMSPPTFTIAVPDTLENRSAISGLRYKHELKLPNLTKFDDYMELSQRVKSEQENMEFFGKMFKDVFRFIDDQFGLGNARQIERLFIGEGQWQSLAKMYHRAETSSTGGSLIDRSIDFEGVIRPKKGSHIIFFRTEQFDRMNLLDCVYNYLLTVAHELLHIAGIKDEIKVLSYGI